MSVSIVVLLLGKGVKQNIYIINRCEYCFAVLSKLLVNTAGMLEVLKPCSVTPSLVEFSKWSTLWQVENMSAFKLYYPGISKDVRVPLTCLLRQNKNKEGFN